MPIEFKTPKGRLAYIKKKALEQRAWKQKHCCVAGCDGIATHYAYLMNGPTVRTCPKHKHKLQPILQKVFAALRDAELFEAFGLENEEEIDELSAEIP